MKFRDDLVNRDQRYSMGVELESGRLYVSIPVSNGLVDYEEYYEITAFEAERYRHDADAALAFVKQCRKREVDHLLLIKPGTNRGVSA